MNTVEAFVYMQKGGTCIDEDGCIYRIADNTLEVKIKQEWVPSISMFCATEKWKSASFSHTNVDYVDLLTHLLEKIGHKEMLKELLSIIDDKVAGR